MKLKRSIILISLIIVFLLIIICYSKIYSAKGNINYGNKIEFDIETQNDILKEEIVFSVNDNDNVDFNNKLTIKHGTVNITVKSCDGVIKWSGKFTDVNKKDFNIKCRNLKSNINYYIEVESEYCDYVKLEMKSNDNINIIDKGYE